MDVYEIEWQSNSIDGNDMCLMLALLAYDNKNWNYAKLSSTLGINQEIIENN